MTITTPPFGSRSTVVSPLSNPSAGGECLLNENNALITRQGIGTLGEKSLHAALKHWFEPDEQAHEVPVGGFVADIVGERGIIEIQTAGFEKLRRKLAVFLEAAPVTVVYPVAHMKWLIWIDPNTGDVTKKRKSPKVGRYAEALPEFYKIKPLLSHPNLRLCVLLVDMEEYRLLTGWSKDKKKGSARYERIPLAVAERLDISCAEDWLGFIPETVPCPFTSKDYAKAAGLNLSRAQTALNVLHAMGVVGRVGKQGNSYLYEETRL